MKKIVGILSLCLIFMCGIVLAGCNDPGGSLSLSFSHTNIEMLTTDETKNYIITVENYNNEVSFDFSFESNYAYVVENSVISIGGGQYQFSIAPISSGTTNLKITLRGTTKALEIPVIISSELNGFQTKQNLFVYKGKTLKLNNSYFKFNPEDTKLTNLTFKLKDGQDLDQVTFDQTTNILSVNEFTTTQEIIFIATSEVVGVAPYEFAVKVVSEIDLSTLTINSYNQNTTNKDSFNFNSASGLYPYLNADGKVTSNHQEAVNDVTLITNEDTSFKKAIGVEGIFKKADGSDRGYMVDVFATEGIIGDLTHTAPITNKLQDFNFVIASSDVSAKDHPYMLTFRIYQADFKENFKDVFVEIYSINTPKDIRINSEKTLETIELYHNSETGKDFRLSVFPSLEGAQNESEYTYSIGVYESTDGIALGSVMNVTTLLQIMDVTYGGVSLNEIAQAGNAYVAGLTNINSILSIKPKYYYNNYFIIKIACYDVEGNEVCANNIVIKIHKGTRDFTIHEEYKDGIYLSLAKGEQNFENFVYDDDSIIGTLKISAKDPTNAVCEIKDISDYNIAGKWVSQVKITPLKVGVSEFTIETLNNKFVPFKVTVIREILETDFALQIDGSQTNNISDFTYRKHTGSNLQTLNSITIKGVGGVAYINEVIDNYTDTNEFSYNYTLTLDELYQDYFEVSGNKIISKAFTESGGTPLVDDLIKENYKNLGGIPVSAQFECYKVDGLLLDKQNVTQSFNFVVKCVDYIKNISITTSNSASSANKTAKSALVYDTNVLPYTEKGLAEAYIYLNLVQSQSTYTHSKNIKLESWSIADFTINADGNVEPIGYFYSTAYDNAGLPVNDEAYVGKFVCDIRGINTTTSFTITLTLVDDTGVEFESTITIKIGNYVDVDNIYLTTATDRIYLDATDSYNTYTIKTYVLPTNAMCQDVRVYIDSNTPSCITYEQNKNTITFKYVSAGEGTIRIFPISNMKTDSIRDAYGYYYYHMAIPFTSADGSEEQYALKLSNYNDLLTIKPNLHYFVETAINCEGQELYIPTFSGSIRGTFKESGHEDFNNYQQTGSILNFKVKNSGTNSGLFGTLTSAAKVYNLTVSGNFDSTFNIDKNGNIGILCGTNNGTISNVQVSIYNQSNLTIKNTAENTPIINIGLVAGNNGGKIEINDNATISTLIVNMNQQFEVKFEDLTNATGTYKINSFVGGVAGLNVGQIINTKTTNIIVGNYGIHANVNIKANADYLGGVAGASGDASGGTLQNIIAVGKMDNGNGASYTAGLIGRLNQDKQVSGNISRVFIVSNGKISGLIGAIQNCQSNVSGNKVQAIDDGRIGIEASLLVGRNHANVYPLLAENNLSEINNNNAESYINRTLATAHTDNLSLDYYYGDMIKIVDNKYSEPKGNFDKGEEQKVTPTVSTLALAAYRQAKDANNQQFIENIINLPNLIELIGISATELKIESNKNNLMAITNHGLTGNIGGTGIAILTFTSSLNYKNKAEISVYLTNYFDLYSTYSDKDHIVSLDAVKVVNQKTKNIYFKCYSEAYNYKNTPIVLSDNTEITFNTLYDSSKLKVGVIGQTISIGVVENQIVDDEQITAQLILNLDEAFFATYNDNLKMYTFMKNADSKASKTISVDGITGIENIVIERETMIAEPSNEVMFNVEYDTLNLIDILTPSLIVDGETQLTYDLSLGVFKNDGGEIVFSISLSNQQQTTTNHFVNTYTFKMVLDGSGVNYNTYKNAEIALTFKAKETEETGTIKIKYTPETISAVLVNNYANEDNEDMVKMSSGGLTYNITQMLNSSSNTSLGDYNVLKAYVYTQLSEFDYVEISMTTNVAGGYLALGKDGLLNKNIQYTSIDGVVTLKAYKKDIIDQASLYNSTQRMLELLIIYSIPNSVQAGTVVPITLTFYTLNGTTPEVCYQKETSVIAKQLNRVEFGIYNKDVEQITVQEEALGVDQAYTVVKGKTYALETNIVGYTEDEIVFESSNPNIAKITNVGGVYQLSISNITLNYGDNEYYIVYISSYGTKLSNGTVTKGRVQKTAVRIYEFLVEDQMFETNKISLRVLNYSDVRGVITQLLKLEYETFKSKITTFQNEFKQNAEWRIIPDNANIIKLSNSLNISTPDYNIKNYEIQPKIVASVAPYKISLSYMYTYKNGVPTCEVEDDDTIYMGTKIFDVEVYINSSEDIPTPIYDYDDLLNMNSDENYRLVNNIEIELTNFQTITSTPKSLDGNGYTITLKGDAYLTNITDFALFNTIAQGSVFKNIKIVVKNKINIQIDNNYATTGVNIALLAATNKGSITNCSIICESELGVSILGTVAIKEQSKFGTICAINDGYITNSQVKANVTIAGAALGGVVAVNNGEIASTYIKESRISNTSGISNENISTGGFVCINAGKISMSYIEGKQATTKIYCDYTTGEYGLSSKIIYTSTSVGGFVYDNQGAISDCYSNIPIVSSSRCAGFVGINDGNITRSFSLSKMKRRDTLNYGFVISTGENATFNNCFFVLEEGIINDYTSESNYQKIGDAYKGVISGVEPLTISDFNISDEYGVLKEDNKFKEYILASKANSANAVWFYAFDSQKHAEVASQRQTYSVEISDLNVYNIDEKLPQAQSFTARVLQLSSPNLIASSRYTLNVEDDGKYYYTVEDNNLYYGSKYNPYLISSAQDLEEYGNQRNGGVIEYYRIIKDINYEEDEVYTTNLVDNTLVAYVEGNNFSISNYIINTKTSYVSAGLFAQIGMQNNITSTIKNITFEPSYVNVPNSVYVGGVAGTLAQANAYNIHLNGKDVIIVGKNLVGGLFGRTIGETYISNVSANVVAKSSQYGTQLSVDKYDVENLIKSIVFDETGTNRSSVSYSGGLVGYVGGSSTISKANIGEQTRAFGVISGLLFGGLGSLATVKDLNINLTSYENEVKAYAFGGIITGHNKGKIQNVTINESTDILNKTLFSCYPIIPLAIGGIAGYMSNGSITNVTSNGYSVIGTSFTSNYGDEIDGKVINIINNPYVVRYAGGVVGYITKGDISSVTLANLIVSGGNYVGGLIGYAKAATIDQTEITLCGHKKYTNPEGNEISELIYMSYVSQASWHTVQNLPTFAGVSSVYVGGLIGGKGGEPSLTNTSVSVAQGSKLYTYFGQYNLTNTDLTSADIYEDYINGIANTTSEEILRQYYNLSTGKTVPAPKKTEKE